MTFILFVESWSTLYHNICLFFVLEIHLMLEVFFFLCVCKHSFEVILLDHLVSFLLSLLCYNLIDSYLQMGNARVPIPMHRPIAPPSSASTPSSSAVSFWYVIKKLIGCIWIKRFELKISNHYNSIELLSMDPIHLKLISNL